MNPWYKVVTLRKEVSEGRSFSPDEFAIALEQVVAGRAPLDYKNPKQFFSRTCFTRALSEHTGMVLRRLTGKTENTAPVLTLITQFGGGKTHTLTALYHLANAGADATRLPGVAGLLERSGVAEVPTTRVGVFVGNAWDPIEGKETPWIDIAHQLAGAQGVAALGESARQTPPGTDALARMFACVNTPILLLFDEVLNFVNRHKAMAQDFHAFIQNLTVAVTGSIQTAAVVSLPRSQVEMTDWDQEWQQRITKVVRRVARDLIANDESEISEVVRRRLFEDIGSSRMRKKVARAYADWCFDRTARLPSEWFSVDTAKTPDQARKFLQDRFEACYPFHPATLSVFQRKWQALAQFQQTRGALAMLAQWISWAAQRQFRETRNEPLITLGSAPLDVPEFRAVVLGQLGEPRLDVAIDADFAGPMSHARALDGVGDGELHDIHQRVGNTILFESSGGQVDKVAHLPELRFALGEPAVETTTIDNAATSLEGSGFFIRKVGTEGYRIHHQATLNKVVSDRRASLDEETDIKPTVRKIVESQFRQGATLPVIAFPQDSESIQDLPRLSLVLLDPETEWKSGSQVVEHVSDWTRNRGTSPRLYPGSLVWCAAKPGIELREKIELWLSWKLVARELSDGLLGPQYEHSDRAAVQVKVNDAEKAAKEEVWASYRFVALLDSSGQKDLKVVDLGVGHANASETLCGRIIAALKSEALLDEGVGAGYIERHWPPAFLDSGAWPLSSLRQSFHDGSLTRIIDADTILKRQIVEFVFKGEFGLASGANPEHIFNRVWFDESIGQEEVVFESGVFLLIRDKAKLLKRELDDTPSTAEVTPIETKDKPPLPNTDTQPKPSEESEPSPGSSNSILHLSGTLPPEVWNRLGTKVLPKLQKGSGLRIEVKLAVSIDSQGAVELESELRRILSDLDLSGRIQLKCE